MPDSSFLVPTSAERARLRGWLALLTLVVASVYATSHYNYLLFHSIVECICALVALSMLTIAWNCRHINQNSFVAFIGITYGLISLFDVAHLLSYKGMQIFAGYTADLPTQLWIAGRYFAGFAALLAVFSIGRQWRPAAVIGIAFPLAAALLVLVFAGWFPACFVEGAGLTQFKIVSEYVVIAAFLAALGLLYRKRHTFDRPVWRLLSAALVLSALADLAFTAYANVYDSANLIGHLLKLLSYLLLYTALVQTVLAKPFSLLFRNLQESKDALEHEVTERRQADKLRALALDILNSLNASEQASDTIRHILAVIKKNLGLDAVAIRLREGHDFPYFVCDGFSADFVRQESSLCARDSGGKTSLREGKPVVECLCGSVLCSRARPELPFFTQGGSFWTNSISELLAHTPSGQLPPYLRGRCQQVGYESVALIPLRSGSEIVGLLQLNDTRRNCFTREMIGSFEGIAASIGIALKRKQAEEERVRLLQSEQEARREAENANRSKDEFLAVLSHELRTPLTAVLGWVRMIRGSKLGRNDEQRGLEIIERNTRAQVRLIEDLLEVSRIVSGKLVLDTRTLDVAAIFDAVVDAAQPLAEARGIELQKFGAGAPQYVCGDPNRLQQIINNLLGNALKFTPRGGRVAARAERVKGDFVVTIADTGIGIDPVYLPYVFDRFSQADTTTTRKYQGLGLGLAIVRHLAQLHGGSVAADSPGKGQGATFTVRLPIAALMVDAPKAPHSPPSALQAPDLTGLRILLVEDEDDAREVVAAALQQYGATVSTAASVREALEIFEDCKPDLLLSDIGLPEEDGYSLIRKIRALGVERRGSVPAIALTAYAKVEDRERALSSGFHSHVAKPVEPLELANLIASLTAAGAAGR